MPAWQLTANSIWTSFRSSGKRHIVLTGSMGSGKTTLLEKLFPKPLPGITTWAEPYQSVWMKDNLTGAAMKIAEYDPSITGTKAKMVLLGNMMADFGSEIIARCINNTAEWITIDEIGFLEENCAAFKEALRRLFDTKSVAAVVRKQDLPFLNELRGRTDVFLIDLDEPFGNCGCVIMASGLGKRFGSNKLMADFNGEPMFMRALHASESFLERRVVVTRHQEIAELCGQMGVEVILHDLPHRSDTVRLGLEMLYDMDGCMFMPADQPLLSRETVNQLVRCWTENRENILRPLCGDTPGAPVLFPKWSFPELLNLPEGKGGGVVMKKHPEKVSVMQIQDPFELMDADTPETLQMLLQHRK